MMKEIDDHAAEMELIHNSASSMRKAMKADSTTLKCGKCNFTEISFLAGDDTADFETSSAEL